MVLNVINSIKGFFRSEPTETKSSPLDDPWAALASATTTTAGPVVGPSTAMRVPAVASSAAIISGAIASLPAKVFSSEPTAGKDVSSNHPAYKQTCSVEIANAVDLAAHTGLRVGDLIRLSWSHVGEDAIIVTTGKSRHRREAIIPLYQELRDVLARIPKRSTVILTSSKGRPWAKDGLSSSFDQAKAVAWPDGDDLHFHDLRGTAATKFYIAGLAEREIAEIMAWEEDHVSRIIRRYVGRQVAIRERIRKLDSARTR